MNNPNDSSDESPQEEADEGSNPETETTRPSHAGAGSSTNARQDVESPRRSTPLGGGGEGMIAEGDNVKSQVEGEGSGGGGGGGSAADASQRTPVKKRSREVDAAGGSSSKKQAEGDDPPRGPFRCSICRRVFLRDKGLFGHMRSHPERNWRGAYPPPVFNREEIEKDLAKVMERVSGHAKGSTDASNVAAEEGKVTETSEQGEGAPTLDLNEKPEGEEEGDEHEAEHSEARPDGKGFDLNKTPPRDSD